MDTKSYRGSVIQTSKYLPLVPDPLTPDIIKKAKEELGETPERKQEALKELRRLINGEKDFRPMMDDAFLIRFLRARKYDTDVALKTLKNYYTFKLRYSRILSDFRPSEVKHVFDMNMLCALPYRDEAGCLVGVGRIENFNLNDATIDELFATVILCSEYVLRSEATQICGVVVVIDLKGLTLQLVRNFASPRLLYRVVRALQDCIPVRIKALHVVNEPFYFSMVFNILKSFLSEKIKKRFQFHGSSLKSLHKEVPAALLPKELGGELGPMDNRDFAKKILEMDGYYDKVIKYGFQEKRAQFIRKKSSMAVGLFL